MSTSSTSVRSLLSVHPLLAPPPKTKLHDPREARQKHDRHTDPRQDQVLDPLVRVHSNLIPVFIDQLRRFALDDRDDDASDQESEEGEGREPEVPEGDQTRAVQEDGDEGGEDREARGGDADAVENKGGVDGDAEFVEAVLDVGGPRYVGEVELEGANGELLVDFRGDVEVICRGYDTYQLLFMIWGVGGGGGRIGRAYT